LASAGAAVAVVARSGDQLAETVSLIEETGGRAISFQADVTDQQAIEQMVLDVERSLGPVALLVNNAGLGGPVGRAWEVDADEWWRCIDVNLRGPFLCARAVIPRMITRRSGRVINMSSGLGLRPWTYGSAYAISKAALIRLGENLAAETKEHSISVFNIQPGFVRTAATEAMAESPDAEKWFGGMFRRALTEGKPFEASPPELAAHLVLVLASGRADALSGCFIGIGDDVVKMVSRAEEIQRDGLHTLRLRT
jgi:NAD(P)-dependent dehydrogenase (short-subunit alcohol dehydrogenase family)